MSFKNFVKLFAISAILIVFSCVDSGESDTWRDQMDYLVEMSCRAQQMKEQRFILADSMRHIEDSLMVRDQFAADKINAWETSLARMDVRKDVLANTSRDLGDTIRMELLRLTKEMDLDEKREFNDSLNIKTTRLGCDATQ